jgi:hypothetical protein
MNALQCGMREAMGQEAIGMQGASNEVSRVST